ncbi:hypothetical protein [Streptosporangium sp. NBC_01756]|uniref:hypothetical protein n=1 Tax=Streptosporangium sp. NBC_01756 TaxID=2975950 RepID=UPI002DDA3082|nr:hypothetical protein [Streptosporangium sp. NBC_01756]WSC86653.1 hypothetical protein OIE48_00025 [Streptosporangium sp. NBC_01756]
MDWTILRPGGFASNAFVWAETIRTQRTAAAPFGDTGLPFIDPADIGEVAAAALREDGHAGQVYELTGPALSTPRQRAEAIGDALGEPIRFIEQTRDEARAQMLQFMPEVVVETTSTSSVSPPPPSSGSAPTSNRSSAARPARSPNGRSATSPPSDDPPEVKFRRSRRSTDRPPPRSSEPAPTISTLVRTTLRAVA